MLFLYVLFQVQLNMSFREFKKKQRFQKSFSGICEEGVRRANVFIESSKKGLNNGRTFGNGKKLPPVTTIVSTGISVVSVGISVVSTITVISVPGFGFSFWGSFRSSFGFSVSGSLSKIVVSIRISVVSVMVRISVISTIVMSVPSFGFSVSLRFSNSGGFGISGAFSQVTVSVSISVGVSVVSAVVSGITTIVVSVPGFRASLSTGFGLRFCHDCGNNESYEKQDFHDWFLSEAKLPM